MSRLTRLFRSAPVPSQASSIATLTAEEEIKQLQNAMTAADFILDEDLDAAERLLGQKDDPFHKGSRAIVLFMRAMMGMEQEVMKNAASQLADAEASAQAAYKSAQTHPPYMSAIYAPGTEFEIIIVQAKMMSAILAVMSQSVTEAAKGFYKVRKAHIMMQRILEREQTYARKKRAGIADRQSIDPVPREKNRLSTQSRGESRNSVDGSDDDMSFIDASEFDTPEDGNDDQASLSAVPPNPLQNTTEQYPEALDRSDVTNTIDGFIHSAIALTNGTQNLMLSLIPPTYGRLLSIVGFRGNRELGLHQLWQSADFPMITGSFAGLVLLGYYNGLITSLDILPSSGPGSYPRQRCAGLIRELRARHPRSVLFLQQDMRRLASERRLVEAQALMDAHPASKLKQMEALQYFDKANNYMYMHDYEKCTSTYLECIEMTDWPKAMHYYNAACQQIELYRLYKYGGRRRGAQAGSLITVTPDSAKAKEYADSSESLLEKVMEHAGKKRMMGRPMPFDVFIARKINKWKARAAEWKVDLRDAIGVSPNEEMIYFWGGYARTGESELRESLEMLAWSDGQYPSGNDQGFTSNPHWHRETADERAILSFLRATIQRHLGATSVARRILMQEVMDSYKWEEFKVIPNGDKWPVPVARYETAVCWWLESAEGKKAASAGGIPWIINNVANGSISDRGPDLDEKGKLQECDRLLKELAAWEPYDLDMRFQMRIKAAREPLAKLGVI